MPKGSIKALLAAAASIALSAGTLTPASAHSLHDLESDLSEREKYVQIVSGPAEEFTLQDSEGNPVSLSDFRGKVVVLYFIYAFCPDVCPINSNIVAEVQAKINASTIRELVQFVAVTTDPETDTPDVLDDYGPSHGLDPDNFVFLTSGPEQPSATRELAARYGVVFTPTLPGVFAHGVVTNVIDKAGNLRARYHGLDFDPGTMVLQLEALANDFDEHERLTEAGVSPVRVNVVRPTVAPDRRPMLLASAALGLALLFAAFSVFRIMRRRVP